MIITMSVCLRSRRGSGRLAGSWQLSVGSCQEELPHAGEGLADGFGVAVKGRRVAPWTGNWQLTTEN